MPQSAKFKPWKSALVVGGLMWCIAASTASAQDVFEWTSASSGSYSDAGRWTLVSGGGSAPPGNGDTARFNEVGSYSVRIAGGAFSAVAEFFAGSVTVRADSSSGANYFLTSGNADLLVSGGSSLTLGDFDDFFEVTRPVAVFVTDNVAIAGAGAVDVVHDSFLSCNDLLVGGITSGSIYIGPTGEISVNSSTSITDGSLILDADQDSEPVGTFSGPTSIGVSIVADTIGTLSMDGGEVTMDSLQVGGGSAATSIGRVNVQLGSMTLTTGSTLTIGGPIGTGTGEVNPPTLVPLPGPLDVGGQTFVNPTGLLAGDVIFRDDVMVDGGMFHVKAPTFLNSPLVTMTNGAQWDVTPGLFIGDIVVDDEVTIIMSGGSDLLAKDVHIGVGFGIPSTLVLDGPGSTGMQLPEMPDEAELVVGDAVGPTSLLQISNGASWETGIDPVTIGTAGAIEAIGGGIFTLHGDLIANGTLDAQDGVLVMDPGLDVTVQGSGQAILPDFDYALAGDQLWQVLGSSWLDMPGSLALNTGGTLVIDGGTATIGDLIINGGVLDFIAGTLDLGGDFILDGDLTLDTSRTLMVGGTTTLFGPDALIVELGTYIGHGLDLFAGALFEHRGGGGIATVTGPVFAAGGSDIIAGDDMALGDAGAANGFYCNGTLLVGSNTVTLNDANGAVFDSGAFVTIGEPGLAGALAAPNGLTLDFGGNIVGFGTIDTPNAAATPVISNGSVIGNSAVEPITLTGYVKGAGDFDNVTFTGTFAPGFSPATVNLGSATYGGTLEIEVGGTTPGSQHDQLNHVLGAGTANLGGTLAVSLINGFEPLTGDEFEVITAAAINGEFTGYDGPAGLEIVYEPTRVLLKAVCREDVSGTDGVVDIDDLLDLLAAWGECPAPCPQDIDEDGTVNINDLLDLLAAWGPCP